MDGIIASFLAYTRLPATLQLPAAAEARNAPIQEEMGEMEAMGALVASAKKERE